MTPTTNPAPNPLQGILNFIFGNKQLQTAAGTATPQANPGGAPNMLGNMIMNHFMQNTGPMVQNQNQSNSYLQPIVDAYMKQQQMQKMAGATMGAAKKKKAQAPAPTASPTIDQDDDEE
jgi:hypothetical protein